jgi:N-acetylglutamate synthase-like GNAT family acetyltransferase
MIAHESCFIYVAEEAGQLVGMIGAIASQIWFSKEALATELFWYVKPDCRGGTGSRLLDALEAGLRERGIAAEQMTTVDKLKSLETYLKRRGFRPSEHSFIRRL